MFPAVGGGIYAVLSPMTESKFCDEVLSGIGLKFGELISHTANSSGEAIVIPEPPNEKWDDEYQFNNAMAPVFMDMFGDRLHNSERWQWLEVRDDAKQDLKPDWFLLTGVPELVEPKVPNGGYTNELVRYATPKLNCSRIVEKILEGKLGDKALCKTDIGVLFKYLNVLATEVGHPFPGGVVYNQREFLYAEIIDGKLCNWNRCNWNTKGSRELIVSLLSKHVNKSVASVLCHLKESDEYAIKSCLGYGRYGCVFHVSCKKDDQTKEYAVKVVVPMSEDFEEEFTTLKSYYEIAPEVVVEPLDNSFTVVHHEGVEYGGYYFMEEVGLSTSVSARTVYVALSRLHTMGITHGDARFKNIIIVNGILKWIDFRLLKGISSVYGDIITLTKSLQPKALDSEAFVEAAHAYSDNPTEENMLKVYEKTKF